MSVTERYLRTKRRYADLAARRRDKASRNYAYWKRWSRRQFFRHMKQVVRG